MICQWTSIDFIIPVLAYLLGSIPFGLVVTKIVGKGDIRTQGSGNIGATNVTRIVGRKLGILVLILDMLKGIVAVKLAAHFASAGCGNILVPLSAGLAVFGHMFPVWLKFKGGKGVATTIAVLLVVYWPVGLATILMWLTVFFFTRISSLSSIFSVLALPSFALYFSDKTGYGFVYLAFFLCVIVIVKHHENIHRLVQGNEKKIM